MMKAAHCQIVLHQAIGDTMSTAEIIHYAAGTLQSFQLISTFQRSGTFSGMFALAYIV